MKIIIAPSKSMKPLDYNFKTKEIEFPKENEMLHRIMMNYDIEEIMNLMKISYKQSEKVYHYYHDNNVKYPALYLYSGTVFKQLSLDLYGEKEFDYLRQLNILSAYYGVLDYNSLINNYRLDMSMKPEGINLYDYWYTPIYRYFKSEDYIIDLSSKEFSRMVNHPHKIFIDFIIYRNGKPTRNGALVKKARGIMLDYMVLNKIDIDHIKDIEIDGFSYHDELSDEHNYVFIK